jgi:hypothetical protein
MRDILEYLENLEESTGLANRKPGDVFRDSNGKEIIFKNLKFYPETGGKLDPKELNILVRQLETEKNIIWMNNRNARSGGLAVATFTKDDGSEIVFGKFLEYIKSNFTNNFVPNQVGDFRYSGNSAKKILDKISPQDLLTTLVDLTADDILDQLAVSLGPNHPLYDAAYKIASGQPFPIKIKKPENISFVGFINYFCEILHPMAIQNGQYTGNAKEVADTFLDGTFNDTYISFSQNKNFGLSDSILRNNYGKEVKISTKAGRGATVSISNLINSIEELENSVNSQKLYEKYRDTIDLIREIKSKGQIHAPLYLAKKFSIINDKEEKEILRLRNNQLVNLNDVDFLDISFNLQQLAKKRKANNSKSVDLFYHIMAQIAYEVAEKINSDTNFNESAADILNHSALIQVHTKAKETTDFWIIENFDTIYPGKTISKVYISAEKTYYSTGIKGNFTFKIDRGSGIEKDYNIDTEIRRERRTVSDKEFIDRAEDIAFNRNRRPFIKNKSASGNVGREKRN